MNAGTTYVENTRESFLPKATINKSSKPFVPSGEPITKESRWTLSSYDEYSIILISETSRLCETNKGTYRT